MKAVVYVRPGEVVVQEVERPRVGPRDILIKVRAVGLCGSDLHTYRTGRYAFPSQIMGHEFCGEVAAVGPEVAGIATGQRATGFSAAYCGACYWCRRQQFRLCPHLFETYTGYGRPGAMADYVKIDEAELDRNVFLIPSELSDEQAAMAEPLGTALYALARTKPDCADSAVVIGAGPIGNLLVQALKSIPVKQVTVTEMSVERAALAKALGADYALHLREPGHALPSVQAVTGIGAYHFGSGAMADLVYDTAGAPGTFGDALEFVRAGGTVALVGLPERPSQVDVSRIIFKDVRVLGVLGSIIPQGLDYLRRGLVKTAPLVTHRFPLHEAAEAFRTMATDPAAMKVMLLPG
ncbi:MAG: alcohol dehydrogenase catalytic domain-containing protein [Thermaerobacter sp.]|nr:alcohol dehydrogenase catalytic domain-containing protein [Thermaerobacter sp.]